MTTTNRVQGFIEGTQRGYAYGLKDAAGRVLVERYVHDAPYLNRLGLRAGIDACYAETKARLAELEAVASKLTDLAPLLRDVVERS